MLIAARNAAWGRKKAPTATDYIFHEPMAVWDGIENVGASLPHDYNTSQWIDLSGNNRHLTKGDSAFTWGDCYTQCRGKSGLDSNGWYYDVSTNPAWIEVVFMFEGGVIDYNVNGIISAGPRNTISKDMQLGLTTGGLLYTNMSKTKNVDISNLKGRVLTACFSQNHFYFCGDEVISYIRELGPSGSNTGVRVGTFWRGFWGRIYRAALCNKEPTVEEIAYNHKIDKVRFGAL